MKRLIMFAVTALILLWWAMCTRQFRAEVAQWLGYLVVPGAVGAAWAWLVNSCYDDRDRIAEAKKSGQGLHDAA